MKNSPAKNVCAGKKGKAKAGSQAGRYVCGNARQAGVCVCVWCCLQGVGQRNREKGGGGGGGGG